MSNLPFSSNPNMNMSAPSFMHGSLPYNQNLSQTSQSFMNNNNSVMYQPQQPNSQYMHYNSYQYPPPNYYDNSQVYSPSKSLNFGFTEPNYEIPEKNFLFAKSKKINSINPPYVDSRANEPQIVDVKSFLSSPWGLKGMLYDVDYKKGYDEYSLKQIPENVSNQYFKERRLYENESKRPKFMIKEKSKENLKADDDDFELAFQFRPKRFLESLEKEKISKKGRSVSPSNTSQMNNRLQDPNQNQMNSFFPSCK